MAANPTVTSAVNGDDLDIPVRVFPRKAALSIAPRLWAVGIDAGSSRRACMVENNERIR